MLKVAITGNIASGKSAAEGILKEKGYNVLDTDVAAHDILHYDSVKEKLAAIFKGYDIFKDNEISRSKLGKIVFENAALKTKLENVVHPLVKIEIKRFFRNQQNQGEKIAFVSLPLLFEAKWEKIFDKIILVYAQDEIRLKRLIKRNNLDLEDAQKRLISQNSQDEKILKSDYVIYNNKTLDDFKNDLEKITDLLLIKN